MSTEHLNWHDIVIFGGTGTIGSIFADVLLESTKDADIYLVSNNEHEIWEVKNKYSDPRIHPVFCDIRDREECRKIFMNLDIGLVVNCAALKHVDLCEDFVANTIKTNILGLENLLYLAHEYTEYWGQFLQVSTDKAVEPVSVMGATKMIGERLCREWNKLTDVSIIRLGNVIDSRGSLIPTLEEQLSKDDVVYFTDEKMYRFLICTKELKEFIFHVLENMVGGEVYIPKMKERNILDFIIEYLVQYEIADRKIKMKKMGRRKGEKFREKLFNDFENPEEHEYYYTIKMEDL